MTHVQDVTLRDLNKRRKAILDRIGMPYEELAAKAAARTLIGDEWSAWEEIREIDFLSEGAPQLVADGKRRCGARSSAVRVTGEAAAEPLVPGVDAVARGG
jgi:hypothetical protein